MTGPFGAPTYQKNKMSIKLTQARLKELLHYDPETGVFTWKTSWGNRRVPGDVAGKAHNVTGYTVIRLDGVNYRGQRLAWLYQTGEWPEGEIDHINGLRSDDRLCNLRACSKAENQQNRVSASGATSKLLGVSWSAWAKRWRAQIKFAGVVRYLGSFHTEDEAHQAYLKAKRELHTFNPVPREAACAT